MNNISNFKRQIDDVESSPSKRLASLSNNNSLCDVSNKEESSSDNSNKSSDSTYTRASEFDVGITEYISTLPGFKGAIKERYSDFLVNEIDLKGNVVKLTTMEKPPEPVLPNKLKDLIDEETILKLHGLSNEDEKCSDIVLEVTDMDKDARKEIHVGIRQTYNNLDSTTEDKEGKKIIRVKKVLQKGNRFIPPMGGNYTHFVLYKENKDTIDTINTIASFLRVQPKIFSYAGTKDKRAKTSQQAAAYRLRPEKLLGINKRFQMIKVGNIQFKPEQLKLGDLSGNSFVIILRQLEGNPDHIENSMKSLSSKGFINYYGMQRFGTSCVPTHAIGRALLCGDWKLAISLILTPKPEDDEDMFSAKKIWRETGDAKSALEKLKRKSSIEAKLLSGIASNNEKDFVNALNAVPRNMRLMYIHSYQSFIWNKVASKRIKTYGLDVLKGDLIENDKNETEENLTLSKEEDKKFTLSNKVKYLSDEHMGRVQITDVLLPLPGHSVVYPDNQTKEWYDEILKADGMSFDNFRSKTKSYSLSGDYRKLVIVPEDVKWEIMSYEDNTQPLCLSDLEVLMGNTLSNNFDTGSLKALKIELKLPSSSYATMALREVQKTGVVK